jgi:hypothetical protein
MTVSTVDVLRAARDLYAQAPSHVRYPETPEPGTNCVLTAIWSAVERLLANYYPRYPLSFSADEALRGAAGHPASIVEWNAEHSTEEVLAAFDRAIEAEWVRAIKAEALKPEAVTA